VTADATEGGLRGTAFGGEDRVLVLGGTGFIGGHVVRALLEAGRPVAVLARGGRTAPTGAELIVADRRDVEGMARAISGRRFAFTVDLSAYDAPDIENLMLVPYAVTGPCLMISTGQVYLVTGNTHMPYREEDSEAAVMPEPEPGTSNHANWVYGVGKRRAERALLSLRATHGVRATIFRIPVVVGTHDTSLRLWGYLERMLDGGPIVLPDGGRRILRFIHAADVAGAVLRLVNGLQLREAVYNLCQPDFISLREFLESVAKAAGCEPRFEDASWDEIEAAGIDRWFTPYGGRWVSVLDPARAGAEFGFLGARVPEYLPGVVRWHLENRPAQSHPGYAERGKELALAQVLRERALTVPGPGS